MTRTTRAAAAKAEEPGYADLGRKLRLRRHIRGQSLQEVARRADISIGFLSQIERGVTTPSLRSLHQICDALDMPMGWLFDKPDNGQGDIVVRAGSRRTMDLGAKGMLKELMSPDSVPEIQMIRIVIRPGGASGDLPYSNHRGAKCGTVLAGMLGLQVDGRDFALEPGDSFAFPAQLLHRFWCIGTQPVDLIWVVTPAVY